MIAASHAEARLHSFDERLEVCEDLYEDLYEGGVDRIADFRWYRHGEVLEVAIVVLLVLELLLTKWGLHLR